MPLNVAFAIAYATSKHLVAILPSISVECHLTVLLDFRVNVKTSLTKNIHQYHLNDIRNHFLPDKSLLKL